MSAENVEIAQRAFDAFQEGFARGDAGAAFDSECVATECEWFPFPDFPGPKSYRGRDGFLEFMRIWTEDFADWSIDSERMIEAPGDRVVAMIHQSGTGKASGVPVESHFGTVYELEAGQVIRIRNFADAGEALRAAGLSE
jgi:ketosteroid isomerase-like protein